MEGWKAVGFSVGEDMTVLVAPVIASGKRCRQLI
jgi:hypothetical protein